MAFGIRPFLDGLRRMLSRRILPTSLGSREIGLRLDGEVKRAAMFSARVEHARVLQRLRDVVGEIVQGVTPEREALREAGEAPVLLSMADAKLKIQQELDAIGYVPAPEDEGTIKDLRTDARLDLMVETNEAVTHGHGRWVAATCSLGSLLARWRWWPGGASGASRQRTSSGRLPLPTRQ